MPVCEAIVIGPYDASSSEPGRSLHLRGHLGDEPVVDGAGGVDALDPDAGLPAVAHRAPDGGVGRGDHVGVVVDDHRVLAAELHEHRGEVSAQAAMTFLPVGADR